MARAEQKFVVDRETVEHLIEMLKDGVEKGATDQQLWHQTWEILDPDYRIKTDRSLKEMREGNIKRFKSAGEMIKDLESD